MTNEYKYNPETRVIDTIPFDYKQSLAPTIENFMLLKHDRAKFFVDDIDVSDPLYLRVTKIYENPERHKEEITWQSLRLLVFNRTRKNKAHPPQVLKHAIKLMKEGHTDESIGTTLNIPIPTISTWRNKLKIKPRKTPGTHFTEDQKRDMLKFIEENKLYMSQPQIAKTLGISVGYIWCLRNPEKTKMNNQTRRQREKAGAVIKKAQWASPLPKAPLKPIPQLSAPIPLPGIAEPKPCKECIMWENKYKNILEEFKKEERKNISREEGLHQALEEQFNKYKVLSEKIVQNPQVDSMKTEIEQLKEQLVKANEETNLFKNMLNRVIK